MVLIITGCQVSISSVHPQFLTQGVCILSGSPGLLGVGVVGGPRGPNIPPALRGNLPMGHAQGRGSSLEYSTLRANCLIGQDNSTLRRPKKGGHTSHSKTKHSNLDSPIRNPNPPLVAGAGAGGKGLPGPGLSEQPRRSGVGCEEPVWGLRKGPGQLWSPKALQLPGTHFFPPSPCFDPGRSAAASTESPLSPTYSRSQITEALRSVNFQYGGLGWVPSSGWLGVPGRWRRA